VGQAIVFSGLPFLATDTTAAVKSSDRDVGQDGILRGVGNAASTYPCIHSLVIVLRYSTRLLWFSPRGKQAETLAGLDSNTPFGIIGLTLIPCVR
jgi:hypothetical protein